MSMALGSHEFNYGMDVLNEFVKGSELSGAAAPTSCKSDGAEAFPPHIMKEVCGVPRGDSPG